MNSCEKCGIEIKEKGLCTNCDIREFASKYDFFINIYGIVSLIILLAQAAPMFGLTELFLDCRDFYENEAFAFFRIMMLACTVSGIIMFFKYFVGIIL